MLAKKGFLLYVLMCVCVGVCMGVCVCKDKKSWGQSDHIFIKKAGVSIYEILFKKIYICSLLFCNRSYELLVVMVTMAHLPT